MISWLPSWWSVAAVAAGLLFAGPAATQIVARPDSALARWARRQAVPLPPVDPAYHGPDFAFLDRLVGNARLLAFGEPVHGGHEPLVFRNHLIRYAVERLGCTAVTLESGLTEATGADDYIQGGAGVVDSIVRRGFTWSFQYLPENRDLLLWLRGYNAHAARKVHLYGIDLTGSEDEGAFPNAARAVRAATAALVRVNPARGAELRARLEPLLDRFLPARYGEYRPAERSRLRADLDSLSRELSAAPVGATGDDRRQRSRGLRNAWMAIRLDDVLAGWGRDGTLAGAALRDSTMAETTRWVVEQEGDRGRVVLFAHDGHVKNAPTAYQGPTFSGSWKAQGQYLRSWLGPKLVTIGSIVGTLGGTVNEATGWLEPGTDTRAEPATFASVLSDVGFGRFALDLRAGDGVPLVRDALSATWTFQSKKGLSPLRPRQAFDAIVFFDRVTPTRLLR